MKDSYLIITGANGQMGSYLARYPALQSYPLLLLYHQRKDRLQGLEDSSRRLMRACELTDLASLQDVIKEANSCFGAAPTRLIHTAAVRSSDAKSIAGCDPEFFAETVRINLMGSLNILKAVLPFAIEAGGGRLVLFTSSVTATGLANGAAYSAAKAAIVNLAKSAALENAAQNVLINCISPAPIETDLSQDYQGEYLEFRQRFFEEYQKRVPTHKLIGMQELAELAVLLTNDALQNLTGQEIYINGGSH